LVAFASVQYESVKPALEPLVTAAVVKSTVAGAQTAAGLAVTTVGNASMLTVTVVLFAQPAAEVEVTV